MLIGLVVLVFANVPIAVALGAIAAVAIVITQGTYMLPNVALTMYEGAQSFPLLAIPMFILAGAIMNSSSISRRLMDFATALVGFIRGGLAHVNIVQSMFFAEISGSAVADVAATGPIIMPAMMRRGYSRAFTAAITSSSASLAIIIPPSIPMILYGVMSGSSIVKLFVAGIVPGLLGGFAMMAISYYLALKHDWPVEERFSLRRVWVTFKETGWALIMPMIILGAIFGGIVTATEGAGVAVVAALVIGGVIYRDLDRAHFTRAAVDGAVQTAVVMLLIATSALLGIYLTEAQVPQRLAAGILELTDNRYARAGHPERVLPDPRPVPAFGCGDHPGRAGRHAARARGRHRSGALRHHRHAQSGDRAADAAGRQRPHRHLLDRQGRHLGSDQGQRLVHRRAARGAAAGDLRPGRSR